MCEDRESGTEEGDEVTQVVARSPAPLGCCPIVVCQLKELVELSGQIGVDLLFCCMSRILERDFLHLGHLADRGKGDT